MKAYSKILTSMTALTLVTTPVLASANLDALKATASKSVTPLTQFTPRPSKKLSIDYDTWDFIVSETVLYMGPSLRTRSPSRIAQTGTRLVRELDSPYRMEGNKVLYPLMEGQVEEDMAAYAQELIQLGNDLDIPALSRNEQLAYWLNLHNAVIVTTIKANYPGPQREPHKIRPVEGSDATLHDAKLMTIDGVDLSLRDIRERIVFPNWENPDVAFGFHLGHLGGPSMANAAYTAPRLKAQLTQNTSEFVNSLRGYHSGKIGAIFYDIAPWYFPDFKTDVATYLKRTMRTDVYAEFQDKGIQGKNRSEDVIADITGGYGMNAGMERFYGNFQSIDGYSKFGASVDDFLVERAIKTQNLNDTDWFKRGNVVIEDILTDDTPAEIE